MNNDCEIVKDLLPTYVDNLTSEKTNAYIENHLNTCSSCKKMFENMKSANLRKEQSDLKKDIKITKKYNRVLRIFELIVILIVIIFLASTLRKIIIINSLMKKSDEYSAKTNFHITTFISTQEQVIISETYAKDNILITNLQQLIKSANNYKITTIEYTDESNSNCNTITYLETPFGKYKFNTNGLHLYSCLQDTVSHLFKNINCFTFLKRIILTNITEDTFNNKKCYKIICNDSTADNASIQYIDKETGLQLRSISKDNNTYNEFSYDFDDVSSEMVQNPNLEGYTYVYTDEETGWSEELTQIYEQMSEGIEAILNK